MWKCYLLLSKYIHTLIAQYLSIGYGWLSGDFACQGRFCWWMEKISLEDSLDYK